MRILLTGASSIAGKHIGGKLSAAGLDVITVSRRDGAAKAAADLTREDDLRSLPDWDAVVHCAGLTPRRAGSWAEFYAANVSMTRLLATAAARREARFFVLISTYGRLRGVEPSTYRDYVVSKKLAERSLRGLSTTCPVWILRAATLYGEHDRGTVYQLIRAVADTRVAIASTSARKCLLYAGSLADVVLAEIAGEKLPPYRKEPIADGRSYSLDEIVRMVQEILGRQLAQLSIPIEFIRACEKASRFAAARMGSVRAAKLADRLSLVSRDVPCLAENALDRHTTARVPLREGLEREVSWLRDAQLLTRSA